MKKKILILVNIILLAVFILPLTSKHHGKHGKKRMRSGKQSQMEKMDIDKSGKVSKTEWKKYHDKKFKEIDTDKNGEIDKEEMNQHRQSLKRKHHRKRK